MVIFFNMIVKRYFTTIFTLLLGVIFSLYIPRGIKAASPSLSFYPSSGIVKDRDDGFTVDVLIDSADSKLAQVRMVFNFDPRQIQIRKASRNNSLFQQWPDDESALDNQNGLVMLTGFTQSGAGELYQTSGDPDLLARIEFDIITEEEEDIILSWEFGDANELFETQLLVDGSPPQNILASGGLGSRPQDAVFRFGELTQTAIDSKYIPFIVGGIIILMAGVLITSKPEFTRKRYGTVVVYD
jgi:hypothetical protein